MKNNIQPIALTLLVLALAGCSKHSTTATAAQKNYDLGVIEISGGKPITNILDDGRVCIITPRALPGGYFNLSSTIIQTNAAGVTESYGAGAVQVQGGSDQSSTIIIDKNTTVTLKTHM
ncbi:MAG: hypothetical protein ACLQSR_16200 [Limisphaerales bacterium]